jgi:hypothetical protein
MFDNYDAVPRDLRKHNEELHRFNSVPNFIIVNRLYTDPVYVCSAQNVACMHFETPEIICRAHTRALQYRICFTCVLTWRGVKQGQVQDRHGDMFSHCVHFMYFEQESR